ncbi:arylamine N-acetyltransferase family protein [Sporobolomyces koalae]|uniref:arylamine N-acetyltransferase family protein n=1 Tax=Sporobolomyces koalae TaxID=500713 RepID=UPI003172D170
MTENTASIWPAPGTSGKLGRQDTLAYLARINLEPEVADAKPSLELLTKIQTAHLLAVPFESTSVHVRDWSDDDADIVLGQGEIVPLEQRGFRHIVDLRRGGYCFLLNGTFPCLLRALGFTVSECLGRVNLIRKEPDIHGVDWSGLSHHILIVDWPASDGDRYLCDVGFGSGPTSPMSIRHGTIVSSIPATDEYQLQPHNYLPYVAPGILLDEAPTTWVLSRRAFSHDSTRENPKRVWIPQYAFSLVSTSHRDVRAMNHFQSTSSDSVFYNLFIATRLHANGQRTTLVYHDGSVDDQGKRAAKLIQTQLISAHENDRVLSTRYVAMKVGPVRTTLEQEFGMCFPKDYAGN